MAETTSASLHEAIPIQSAGQPSQTRAATFALLGAPNCGKTVLFNGLTGAHAKVANYAGVTNLRMTLRMMLELKTLGLPMVISLNLSDVARSRGLKIDAKKLSELLGATVLETVAISRSGIMAVEAAALALPRRHAAKLDPVEAERKLEALDSNALYEQVEDILSQVVQTELTLPAWHRRLDNIVMHPFWGMLILLTILLLVFQAVYTWAQPVMDSIQGLFDSLGGWVGDTLPQGLLSDLLVNGVIAGTGSVLVFLPQITILFAFILLLEDSGYLPRAAFLLDNLLSRTGLSGRAFIPLLSSFACAVPAVMSARTIQDPRERLVTIAIAPMLTCSARLPIYALIIAAVIPNQTVWGVFNLQGLTLFALYLAGILSAALTAWVLKWMARSKGNVQQFPLLMELPTFRMPNFRHIITSLWDRVKAFLVRAGTVIFSVSVVLWALTSFPSAPEGATGAAIDYSLAGMLGHLIQPIFAPLGFTWQMCIAMVPGIAAREVVVAALGTVYAVGAGSEDAVSNALIPIVHNNWGIATAFSFLAWYVYAPMCASTLAVIRRETKSARTTFLITFGLLALAYVMAMIVYQITSRIF